MLNQVVSFPENKSRGGTSNILYYCSLPKTHTPLKGEPEQVLLRMYGQMQSTDNSQSTVKDSVIFMLLSERQMGPKLYGVFPGGRLEEYLPARALLCSELHDKMISSVIAKKLAHIHSLDVPINKESIWLFKILDKWLKLARNNVDLDSILPDKRKILENLLEYDFENEVIWLKKYLKKLNSPILFCHNDVQEGNVLMIENSTSIPVETKSVKLPDELEERIVFIDFEYCGYNYRGFDIANHFCEFAFSYSNPEYPYYNANLDNYPTEAEQRHFIKEYIKHSKTCNSMDEEIIKNEVECFALASHMIWTLWSIHNGHTSQIEFGYWEYGQTRLNAYELHKKTIINKYDR